MFLNKNSIFTSSSQLGCVYNICLFSINSPVSDCIYKDINSEYCKDLKIEPLRDLGLKVKLL